MRSSNRHGPLLVLGAATLWGTTGTAQALGPEGISPESVAFVRMAGGSLLLGFATLTGRSVALRELPVLALVLATAAMAGSQPLFFEGVDRTGVAVGTIVTIGSGPILAGLLAWVVRRESLDVRWVVATALASVGAVVLVSGGEAAGVDLVGLLFAFGAGLAWAVYLVAAKGLFEAHSPVFVAGVVFAGAAVLLAPVLVVSDTAWMSGLHGLGTVVWLGVVTTALSYVLFATGLGATPVAAAATLTLAEPLTAAVLGIAVLDEPARLSTLLGIVLIGVGIALLTVRRRPEPAQRTSS